MPVEVAVPVAGGRWPVPVPVAVAVAVAVAVGAVAGAGAAVAGMHAFASSTDLGPPNLLARLELGVERLDLLEAHAPRGLEGRLALGKPAEEVDEPCLVGGVEQRVVDRVDRVRHVLNPTARLQGCLLCRM